MAEDEKRAKPQAEGEAIKKWAAAGVGIGSAAIVAALLYVNHAKKKPAPAKKRWTDE